MQVDQGKPSIWVLHLKLLLFWSLNLSCQLKEFLPQMEEGKKKGLCYNCDEKWGVGHKCKNAMFFLLDYVELAQENINSGVHITELEETGSVDQIWVGPREC